MGRLAEMFFPKLGSQLFYGTMVVYLFGIETRLCLPTR